MDNVEIRRTETCIVKAAFLGYAVMISSAMPKLSIEHIKRTSPNKYRDDDYWCSDMFGHVRLFPDTVPVHTALRLSIDARSGRRVDG